MSLLQIASCVWRPMWAATLMIVACNPYDPSFPNLMCGEGNTCPDGSVCVEGVCRTGVAEQCGDGIKAGQEICDDGNTVDSDGCNATCTVATCYVPVTHATLSDGLADAACATVYLQSGTHTGLFELVRDVTIMGTGIEPIVLDGNQSGSVLTVADSVTATVRNLTVRSGKALAGGGIVNRGVLTLDLVTVTENVAEGASPTGGGIENIAGSLTLNASVVSKNRLVTTTVAGANLSGVGIHSTGGSIVITEQSFVEENDLTVTGVAGATVRGGGIGSVNTMVTLSKNSAVRSNDMHIDGRPGSASVFGAGIYVDEGRLTITEESIIANNIAAAEGVALGGVIGAQSAGGGIYCSNSIVLIESSVLKENKVSARGEGDTSAVGGAGAIRGGTMSVTGGAILANIASSYGVGPATIAALAGGGGFDIETSNTTFINTSVNSNALAASTESASRGTALGAGMRVTAIGDVPQTVTFTRSTLDNNKSTSSDGSAYGGGIYTFFASNATSENLRFNIIETTISNNELQSFSSALGGGIRAFASDGDPIMTFNFVNSTISGNKADSSAGQGAGGAILGGLAGQATARMFFNFSSVTITGNSALGVNTPVGGGMYLAGGNGTRIITTMKNSILAANVAANSPDCSANITSGGYNLVGQLAGCAVSSATGDRTGSPGLGPLSDNGGPTRTHALSVGSQAINAGNPAGCTGQGSAALATDQRGLGRVVGRCDIGAFEVQ